MYACFRIGRKGGGHHIFYRDLQFRRGGEPCGDLLRQRDDDTLRRSDQLRKHQFIVLAEPFLQFRAHIRKLKKHFPVQKGKGNMTKERIEKELAKVRGQLESLQAKQKDLEEQKRMAERAEKMDIIEKHKISSEKLQLLIKFSEDEILKLLEEKENAKEMAGNEEKVIS